MWNCARQRCGIRLSAGAAAAIAEGLQARQEPRRTRYSQPFLPSLLPGISCSSAERRRTAERARRDRPCRPLRGSRRCGQTRLRPSAGARPARCRTGRDDVGLCRASAKMQIVRQSQETASRVKGHGQDLSMTVTHLRDILVRLGLVPKALGEAPARRVGVDLGRHRPSAARRGLRVLGCVAMRTDGRRKTSESTARRGRLGRCANGSAVPASASAPTASRWPDQAQRALASPLRCPRWTGERVTTCSWAASAGPRVSDPRLRTASEQQSAAGSGAPSAVAASGVCSGALDARRLVPYAHKAAAERCGRAWTARALRRLHSVARRLLLVIRRLLAISGDVDRYA